MTIILNNNTACTSALDAGQEPFLMPWTAVAYEPSVL